VLRFEDIAGPVACDAGSIQHDTCEQLFCALRMQLGISADPTGCEPHDGVVDGVADAAPSDGIDAATSQPHTSSGCCETSTGGGPAALVLALIVTVVLAASRQRALRIERSRRGRGRRRGM
jgi:hypothetical protein